MAFPPTIAIFIRSLKGGGGAQRAMVRFATGLARRGYDTTVVTLHDGAAFDAEIDSKVKRVVLKGGRLAGAVPALAKYLRQTRPATLFTTEPASNVVCILAERLARSGARVVIREGLFPSVAKVESPHRATRWAYRVAPFVYRRADAIIAIASDMAADLAATAKVPASKITTIAVNPVVTSDLLESAARTPEHPWLNEDGPPVVLGVGRFSKQKDFATLLRAFMQVREQRPCRLLLLGEGPERPALEAVAAASPFAVDIAMPGFVREPFAAMRTCSVFVLSSRYEGLPNVLIEAIASGAAVVSTDCPSGPRDVLGGGQFGPLVPVGDVDAMAAAIRQVLDTPVDRAALIARGSDFSVEKSLDRYLPVLFPDVMDQLSAA